MGLIPQFLKRPSDRVRAVPKMQHEPRFEVMAADLPPVPLPTPPSGQTANPSFRTRREVLDGRAVRTDRNLATTDLSTLRNSQTDSRMLLRELGQGNPDLGATKTSYLRIGIPEEYTLIARDASGQVDRDATETAASTLRRMNLIGRPDGFNSNKDLQSCSEALARELLYDGAASLELAPDAEAVPSRFVPISTTTLQWRENANGLYPIQVVSGEEISLDIPTFFYVSIDQDLLTAYSTSYLETAVQAVLADVEFFNNLRRQLARNLQPRMVATIVEETFRNSLPAEVRTDSTQYAAAMQALVNGVTSILEGLQPSDALVETGYVEYKMMGANSGGGGASTGNVELLKAVQEMIDSKTAAGAKTMSAILGRDSSGTAASVTTMLFLKNANIIRMKLNALYSRALTMAVRIMGHDATVEFDYAPLDIRPTRELAAYKAMENDNTTRNWSLGLLTDDEAALRLTGNLTPTGFAPLSGTMFHQGAASTTENPNSQTSTMNQGGAPDASKSDAPTGARGRRRNS